MPHPPRLVEGGIWTGQLSNPLLQGQSLSSNQYYVGMCSKNPQMPLPKGMLLGSNPLHPTHHQPGRVGHNSDRCIMTREFQACQLSRESHYFSASLTVSWPHKLISQLVHFAVWISTDASLTVQVTLISYLQGRMQCDVGNLLTAEEGSMFMRLNRTHTNCVSKGWWHQASKRSSLRKLPKIYRRIRKYPSVSSPDTEKSSIGW